MATFDAVSPRRRFWRRKGTCNSSYFVPAGRAQSYSSGGGVPTQWYVPNLHGPVPPYPAAPQQLYPPPQPLPPQPPPPQPASSRRLHGTAAEEEELMQLAMAMSMSEAEPHAAAAAAAAAAPQQKLPPLRRHSQPQVRPPQRQGRHPRRADTLSDEALARALGDMYSEELANEQQLLELRSSGRQEPPLLRPSQPQRALPPRQPQQQLHSPTTQHSAHLPRLGGRVANAGGSVFTDLPAPSPEAVGPPGFGRSLAPLLPSHAASAAAGLSANAAASAAATVAAALAASAPQPALTQPPRRPPLPPVRTHTAAPPSPAGHSAGGASQRLHSHSSSGGSGVPQRPSPSPSQVPDSSASSSDWFDFLAADTPPPGTTSADAAAAPAEHSMANPLARQSRGPGAVPDLRAAPGSSAAYAAEAAGDSMAAPSITRRQLAEQLPDLIQLASPELRPPLHLPASNASSQPPHFRTTAASLPPPPAAGGAAGSWDQPQRSNLGSADGAAATAETSSLPDCPGRPSQGGAAQHGGISGAAVPENAAAPQQRYAEQRAWWQQQLERQGYHQQSRPQPQTYPQAWSQQPAGSQLQPQLEVVGQQASADQLRGSAVSDEQAEQQQHGWQAASQDPWWQQRRQEQQRPWTPPEPPQLHAAEQPTASPVQQDSLQSAGDAPQQPWPPAQPVQLQQVTGQQGSPEQPVRQAQAVSQAASSQRVPGALWSTFFEFPADSELSDCHPALLQAAKLQQEAAATMAAAAAEDPAGRISPAHWRAMHLDIADAYLCPITQEVTEDPVIAADSFTYERTAIAAWLRHHDTSPMTNAALPNKELIPNHAARSAIRTLREAGILDPPPDD